MPRNTGFKDREHLPTEPESTKLLKDAAGGLDSLGTKQAGMKAVV